MSHEADRITVPEKELSAVIAGIIHKWPDALTEKFVEYRILKLYKRQDMEPRVNSEMAALIARELTEKGWEVTYPKPQHPGSPPACGASD